MAPRRAETSRWRTPRVLDVLFLAGCLYTVGSGAVSLVLSIVATWGRVLSPDRPWAVLEEHAYDAYTAWGWLAAGVLAMLILASGWPAPIVRLVGTVTDGLRHLGSRSSRPE
jgi:hypothetical protein